METKIIVKGKQWVVNEESKTLFQPMSNNSPKLPQYFGPDIAKKHQQTLEISRTHRLDIRWVNILPAFTDIQTYFTEQLDFAVMPIGRDPVYYANGNRLVIPHDVYKRMSRLQKAGVNFEAMYIIHEVEKGVLQQGQEPPIEWIAPPPPQFSQQFQKLNQMMTSKPKVKFNITTSTNSSYDYDPILLGVHLDYSHRFDGNPIGLWYKIADWRWSDYQ